MNRTGKPCDITKHPLNTMMYAMCRMIEELPASTRQTALSVAASEFADEIWNYYEEKIKEPEKKPTHYLTTREVRTDKGVYHEECWSDGSSIAIDKTIGLGEEADK